MNGGNILTGVRSDTVSIDLTDQVVTYYRSCYHVDLGISIIIGTVVIGCYIPLVLLRYKNRKKKRKKGKKGNITNHKGRDTQKNS